MEQGTFDFGGDTSPAPVKLCGCGCGKPAPIASRTVLKRGVIKGQPLKFIRWHYDGSRGGAQRTLFVEAGQRFGQSEVIDPDVMIRAPGGRHMVRGVRMRCDCGTEYELRLAHLFKKKKGSRDSGNFIDWTDLRYGKLIVIRQLELEVQVSPDAASWLCKCDCGNEVTVYTACFASGHVKSCGCWKDAPLKGYRGGDPDRNKIFRVYQFNARSRGLTWELTGTDFERLTGQHCYYCGNPPSMTAWSESSGGAKWIYNGIDRIDNSKGYTADNAVSCCKICNHAKVDMTFDEFIAWIARLTEYHWFHPDVMPSALLRKAEDAA